MKPIGPETIVGPFVCTGCGDPSPGALPGTGDPTTDGRIYCGRAKRWVFPMRTELWNMLPNQSKEQIIAAARDPGQDLILCTMEVAIVASTGGLVEGSLRPCGQIAHYRDEKGRNLCPTCSEYAEEEGVKFDSLYYCGFCLHGLIVHRDGSGGCVPCEFVWENKLTKDEAKVFQAAWDGFGPSKAGLDYPDRADAAWEAVGNHRRVASTC